MRLIVFAGLPGTGKSTLARLLAARLGCPVFDKDRVREALFGPAHVEYSTAQDDRCVEAILTAVASEARAGQRRHVILDGRTFSRAGHTARIESFAREHGIELRWIRMSCDPALAQQRLAQAAVHPAADRSPALHERLRRAAEPFAPAHLELCSDPSPGISAERSSAALLARALGYVAG